MCVCVCESELPVGKPTALTDSSTFIFFVLPVNPPHPPLTPPSASLTTFDGFTAVIQEVAAQSCTLRSSELQALSDGQETGVKRTETRLKRLSVPVIGSKRLQLRWKVLVNGCCSVARNTKDLTRYGGVFFQTQPFFQGVHYGKIKAETEAMSNFELEIFLNSVGCNYTVLPCGGAEEKVKDTGQVVHIHQALNHVLSISRAGSSHKKIR